MFEKKKKKKEVTTAQGLFQANSLTVSLFSVLTHLPLIQLYDCFLKLFLIGSGGKLSSLILLSLSIQGGMVPGTPQYKNLWVIKSLM